MATHRKNQREQQKSRSRRRLIARATALCERRGFAGLATAEVARRARLSHGAVFVHFPTRDALVAEVAGAFAREVTDRLHALLRDAAPLRDVLYAHLEAIASREDLYRHALMDVRAMPKAFRSSWIGIQSAVSGYIARAAEREIARGTIRPVAPHLLFNTWVGLVHHYLMNRDLFVRGGSVLEAHGRMLVDHMMRLLATKEARP